MKPRVLREVDMKASRAGLLFSCAVVAMACASSPAYAQVKDIIVTAQKRTQSDKDVPISLQVVSGNDLQNNQIADTEQLAVVFWIGWEGAVLRAKLERSAKPLEVFAGFFFASLAAG